MAYAQWIAIAIHADNMDITIKNAALDWGKFYQNDKKDDELSKNDLNGTVIKAGQTYTVYSCGRSDASSGTKGSFKLFNGETELGKFKWDCPWGSKTNSYKWSAKNNESYQSGMTGGNKDSGAIGDVSLTCIKVK